MYTMAPDATARQQLVAVVHPQCLVFFLITEYSMFIYCWAIAIHYHDQFNGYIEMTSTIVGKTN